MAKNDNTMAWVIGIGVVGFILLKNKTASPATSTAVPASYTTAQGTQVTPANALTQSTSLLTTLVNKLLPHSTAQSSSDGYTADPNVAVDPSTEQDPFTAVQDQTMMAGRVSGTGGLSKNTMAAILADEMDTY